VPALMISPALHYTGGTTGCPKGCIQHPRRYALQPAAKFLSPPRWVWTAARVSEFKCRIPGLAEGKRCLLFPVFCRYHAGAAGPLGCAEPS